ncbi:MAG TPA: hypothetical protein VNN08_08250, partial [Thermoanaerobaculia bacterium]|nr:hypothetical protein [Thermoanaerobaculia bacterium]
DLVEANRGLAESKRDLVESKRDLVEAKRDLVESKRDLVKAKRDLVETKRGGGRGYSRPRSVPFSASSVRPSPTRARRTPASARLGSMPSPNASHSILADAAWRAAFFRRSRSPEGTPPIRMERRNLE